MLNFNDATEAELLAMANSVSISNYVTVTNIQNRTEKAGGVLSWNDAQSLIKLFKSMGYHGFTSSVHGVELSN